MFTRLKKGTGRLSFLIFIFFLLQGCAYRDQQGDLNDSFSSNDSDLPLFHGQAPYNSSFDERRYASALPDTYPASGTKTILVDPSVHAWAAYDETGNFVRGGMATAGAEFCQDEGRPCKTNAGTFRIYSMGDADCVSRTFPLGEGGALMPYCMFFNNGQSLHGSPDQMMVAANISHGCVHLRIPDAQWLRSNFADIGTRVVVMPY